MPKIYRTPDERFGCWKDFSFDEHFVEWEGLRMHYVDEGPRQDWGGPIGLRQAVDMPERFERLAILNTWLHHPEHAYTEAIRRWNQFWQPGGMMDELQGCGFVLRHFLTNFPTGSSTLTPEEAFEAYEAPFPDRASKAGPRP